MKKTTKLLLLISGLVIFSFLEKLFFKDIESQTLRIINIVLYSIILLLSVLLFIQNKKNNKKIYLYIFSVFLIIFSILVIYANYTFHFNF